MGSLVFASAKNWGLAMDWKLQGGRLFPISVCFCVPCLCFSNRDRFGFSGFCFVYVYMYVHIHIHMLLTKYVF